MNGLALHEIDLLAAGRFGVIDVACPVCGPTKRAGSSQRRPVLRIWRGDESFATFKCARCDLQGYARGDTLPVRQGGNTLPPCKTPTPSSTARRQSDKAAWLWSRSLPALGSIVETYLRQARGIGSDIPSTIRFMPASGEHLPCMVSAFGLPIEREPGVLQLDEVRAVHLTKLSADGNSKAGTDADKIAIGTPRGLPIAVAPITDGLGLVIAEGIEDALSVSEATGLGAWAAGSAPFLPYLADTVPEFVEVVTLVVDDDKAGRRKCDELAERLEARGIEVRLFHPARSVAA